MSTPFTPSLVNSRGGCLLLMTPTKMTYWANAERFHLSFSAKSEIADPSLSTQSGNRSHPLPRGCVILLCDVRRCRLALGVGDEGLRRCRGGYWEPRQRSAPSESRSSSGLSRPALGTAGRAPFRRRPERGCRAGHVWLGRRQ